MRPRWQNARWQNRHERQRQEFAAELDAQGLPELAARVRRCCHRVALSTLDCCASEQKRIWNTCGVRGCPVCQGAAAKKEARTLWSYARHLEATSDRRPEWRHIVLTSINTRHASVQELYRLSRVMKDAARELWSLMAEHEPGYWEAGGRGARLLAAHPELEPWSSRFASGMRCYLECSSTGMVHIHALVVAHWVDPGWLKRSWASLTGFGYHDQENDGELRSVCQVNALYHYASERDRRRGRKTYGATLKSFKELGKYLTSPKGGPVLGARMAAALVEQPRSWGYGCFVGLGKLRESSRPGKLAAAKDAAEGPLPWPCVLVERDRESGELRPQHRSHPTPEWCPHCGTLHPRRRCTPWLDLVTGELAARTMRPLLRLLVFDSAGQATAAAVAGRG